MYDALRNNAKENDSLLRRDESNSKGNSKKKKLTYLLFALFVLLSIAIWWIKPSFVHVARGNTHSAIIDNEEDTDAETPECGRFRKPWQMLSVTEKALYTTGYQKVRKNKKLYHISHAHAHSKVDTFVHGSSIYPFYHAYIVYELESAIRQLGGDYACFAMPYWDFGLDAGYEDDPEILNSGVGGTGDNDNTLCVVNDDFYDIDSDSFNWALPTEKKPHTSTEMAYWTPLHSSCASVETYPQCCLKRELSNTQTLTTASELSNLMYSDRSYKKMLNELADVHSYVHLLFGNSNFIVPFTGGSSTDDPMFFLLHSFLEYVRVMWSSCNGYDKVDLDEIANGEHPMIYHEFCLDKMPFKSGSSFVKTCQHQVRSVGLGIDDSMRFFELKQQDWTLNYNQDISIRTMWDVTDFDISYELGPWFEESGTSLWCKDGNLNTDVFKMTMQGYGGAGEGDVSYSNEANEYARKIRDEMEATGLYTLEEIMAAGASGSCQYVRKNSGNSCWDETMEDIEVETCEGMSDEEVDAMELDDFLSRGGVVDNECLQQIRSNLYDSKMTIALKRRLCDSDFDYKCPEWVDERR